MSMHLNIGRMHWTLRKRVLKDGYYITISNGRTEPMFFDVHEIGNVIRFLQDVQHETSWKEELEKLPDVISGMEEEMKKAETELHATETKREEMKEKVRRLSVNLEELKERHLTLLDREYPME